MIQKNTKHSFDSQDLSQLIPLVPDIIHRPKIPRQARDSPHHPSILSPFLSQHILAGATYKSCPLLPRRLFTLHGVQITRLTTTQPFPASQVIGGRSISPRYNRTPQFLSSEFPPIPYCAIHRNLSIEIPSCSARPSTPAVPKDMATYAAETERLYLEPLGVQHLEDFHELWNNDEAVLWSYVPFPFPLSLNTERIPDLNRKRTRSRNRVTGS
jgi:hypothetical protein